MRFLLAFSIFALGLYAGSLSEKDPDLSASFERMNSGSANNRQTPSDQLVLLNYEGQAGDYLSFYDYRGARVYLRFRRDKWDYDNDFWLHHLRFGQTYNVKLSSLKRYTPENLPDTLGKMLAPSTRNHTIAELRRKTSGSFPDPIMAEKIKNQKAEKRIRTPAFIYESVFSGCYPAALDMLRK